MNKKIIPLFLIIIIIGVVFFTGESEDVYGEDVFSLYGYAWSENIGWISFNCENTGVCDQSNYGVRVTDEGGLYGYAWSENIGWIKFNDLDNFPEAPHYSAKVDVDGTLAGCEEGKLCGWARALAGLEDPDDGWDGWIKLGGENDQYTLNFEENPTGNREFQILGWAWGSDVVGWISFNCENTGVCNQSDYRVETDFYPSRPEISFDIEQGDYCNQSYPQVTLIFEYDEEDNIEYYDIEVIKTDNDHKVIDESGSFSPTYPLPEQELDFDTEYLARVQVVDDRGISSEWEEEIFTTKIRYPQIYFDWTPSSPKVDELVNFSAEDTNYYGWLESENRQGEITLRWTFPEEAKFEELKGEKSSFERVDNEFSQEGSYQIILEVEADVIDDKGDFNAESCSLTKNIQTEVEVPEWEEVDPF